MQSLFEGATMLFTVSSRRARALRRATRGEGVDRCWSPNFRDDMIVVTSDMTLLPLVYKTDNQW